MPYLALDLDGASLERRRGVLDAIGLRLRHSDRSLHLSLSPARPLERIIFDIAEQFRCESLASLELLGVRANISAAFEEWSEAARNERIGETGVGMLVYTVTHMLRFRLLKIWADEAVDDLIETTRGNLGRLIGHALGALPTLVHSQEDYAEAAREIARLIAELADDAGESDELSPQAVTQHRLLIPVDWETLEEELALDASGQHGAGPQHDYRIFSTVNDIELSGADLYRTASLRSLRTELDRSVAAQAVSLSRLAQRLQTLFPSWRIDGWKGGEDDGPLDPGRLAQIVATPTNPQIRRLPQARPTSEAAVTFLIDTSGSMKLQRFETVAVVVETFARALELAGATCEVLGFTTASWAGGQAAQDWRAAGSPPEPGRLADLQHIVYKAADRSWKQERLSMAAMLRTDHYREGVDGEAIEWAWQRLVQRPESRRALVVISDGSPMESATTAANRDHYLIDHLRAVCDRISGRDGAGVELGTICLDDDQSDAFVNAVSVDLDQMITIGTYNLLHDLFG